VQVGDLVTVKPAKGSLYFITKVYTSGDRHVKDCVQLWCADGTPPLLMEKRWIEVVSER